MRKNYIITQIKKIILPYNLGTLKKFKIFKVGIENTNIYLKTDKREAVLKIYEVLNKTEDLPYIKFELSLMKRAFQCGFPVPQILKTKAGKEVTIYKGQPIILMSFLPGENIIDKPVSLKLIKEVAQVTAKMDKCFRNFKVFGKERKEHYWDLKRFEDGKIYLKYLKFDKQIDRNYILEIYREYVEIIKPVFSKLKKGYIHGDVASHNILAKGDRLTAVLDFSDAVFGYCIFEVAVSIAQLCLLQKNWQEATRVFFKEYTKILPLNKTERGILFHLLKCRLANEVVICNGFCYTDGRRMEYIWFHDHGLNNLRKLEKFGKKNFDELIKS